MAKNIEVVRYEKRLKNLFEQANNLPDDPLILAHWARYLCILSSGYLETAIRATYSEYARKQSSPNVAGYVENRLKNFRSAKMSRIIELTRMFNPDWADQLKRDTEGELANSVDSIVDNRHSLAHGKDTGVSLVNLKNWHRNATKVITLIEKLCN